MSHAIIRGKGGRRHEANFDDAEVEIIVHLTEECAEIVIEGKDPFAHSDKQPFAIINIPRKELDKAYKLALKNSAVKSGNILKIIPKT